MASDDSTSSTRTASQIVLRIKLRYDDLDTLVLRFAINIGKSGVFLPTKSLQPVGAEIKFELRLADDRPVLVGLGRVKAAVAPDPQDPRMPFGMAIELMRVTPQSRALILRMLEYRAELGLPEIGLPMAGDVAQAREVELAYQRMLAAESGDELATRELSLAASSDVAIAVPRLPGSPGSANAPAVEPLLTAARPPPPAFAAASGLAVSPLAPEPLRRRRTAVSELVERASGPVVAALPGLDDSIDVAAAIARARALAGATPAAGIDAALEALTESAAPPVEISIDAASAELARQLGGSAVRRDRSARWSSPPATAGVAAPAAEPVEGPVTEAMASVADPDASVATALPQPPDPEPEAMLASDTPHEPQVAYVPTGELPSFEPERLTSELEAVGGELDLDDAEHTEHGGFTAGRGRRGHLNRTTEASPVAMTDADLELDNALAVAVDRETGDHVDAVFVQDGLDDELVDPPHDLSLEEIDDFEILAEDEDAEDELLAIESALSEGMVVPEVTVPRTTSELDFAARLDLGDDSDLHRAARRAAPVDPYLGSHLDSHLDSAGQALAAFDHSDASDDAYDHDSTAAQSGVQPIFEPETSNSFTVAGLLTDSLDLDAPSSALQPMPAFPAYPEPTMLHRSPVPLRVPAAAPQPAPRSRSAQDSPSLYETPVEDHELEHALEALDVDLDDLSIPHASTHLPRPPLGTRRGQTLPPPSPARASSNRIVASLPPSDDEMEIEFEEEE